MNLRGDSLSAKTRGREKTVEVRSTRISRSNRKKHYVCGACTEPVFDCDEIGDGTCTRCINEICLENSLYETEGYWH